MATLIVEDGTIVPNANCFISVVDCDTYHSDRGNVAWTAVTDVLAKEAAILKAADYLNYGYDWVGVRISSFQPMQWPRDAWGIDPALLTSLNINIVPAEVVKANAELALLALTGDLMPAETGGRVLSESKSISGAVSVSRTYAGGGGSSTQRRFPFIDRIVAKYATGGSSGVRGQSIERC